MSLVMEKRAFNIKISSNTNFSTFITTFPLFSTVCYSYKFYFEKFFIQESSELTQINVAKLSKTVSQC